MTDIILVLNAGSSSIKFSMFAVAPRGEDLPLSYRGSIDGIGSDARFVVADADGRRVVDQAVAAQRGATDHEAVLPVLHEWIAGHTDHLHVAAVGHRVVHGGEQFSAPVRIDDAILDQLEKLAPLAPLHQPHNLAPIRVIARIAPDIPQVACFDTAFHRTQPPVSQLYALPRDLSVTGIKRYGFHGLSYEYIASVLPRIVGDAARDRVVVAHLGNGCSMCAMRDGKSVATTMGFTALEGLPMGTRCGAIDPGVVLYLLTERGMSVADVSDLLYHRSGLLGVSGVSNDMRKLLASNTREAAEAIELFVYRINRELGSLVAALGGLDVLVFTAGIGEHAPSVRARVCEQAAWLGVQLDPAANAGGGPRVSSAHSRVSVWVIPTNEELMIA
ncbi:MAG TPA: acetate/propionate family kinase, partial [Methylomirabilota bacterium]|nr:acetate/propionate family kinase [Methylomirabilota bacterium]